MRLVCEDLQRGGWRAGWFNAWHHQTEEQLLPALLEAIRRRGIPHWLSIEGVRFRLLLLLIRSRALFALSALLLFVGIFAAAFLITHQKPVDLTALAGLFGQGKAPSANVDFWPGASEVGAAIGLFIAVAAFAKRLKPFGLDPAVLLAGTLDKVRMEDMSAQTSSRTCASSK